MELNLDHRLLVSHVFLGTFTGPQLILGLGHLLSKIGPNRVYRTAVKIRSKLCNTSRVQNHRPKTINTYSTLNLLLPLLSFRPSPFSLFAMPSLILSESELVMKALKKEKKLKAENEGASIEGSSEAIKKSMKSRLESDEEGTTAAHSVSNKSEKVKEKKKKKRKAVELDDSEKSETSSELGEPINSKGSKKAKLTASSDGEQEEEENNPNALSNFQISMPLKVALISKGIKSLFPIQAMTFHIVLNGSDLVGRARTGQGKTLAFVLPILESLANGRTKGLRKTGYGRPPSVLVLLPTRELASQVYVDFEVYGGAIGLTSLCLYGGGPDNQSVRSQEAKLKRGVDIVVGTPGRVKDHVERGNINLGFLQFRVLDEADEMLRMGFVEDVELILGQVEDVSKVQTLLFSATLPAWVKQISSKFLKSDKKTVDLVGDQKMKASIDIRHIVIPCSSSAKKQLIPDIIRCYSSGGRSIVFTERKDSASQLAGLLPGARALHGEIQQSTREATLSGFRSGLFMTLVATNVAARGLDINDVQLIIQYEPPRDVEAYIHRSGRTGRAGNTGVAVMLFDPTKERFTKIERESGVKFEHLSAPQPFDVAKAAGVEAAECISKIPDSVIPAFKASAQELLNNSGLSTVDLLSKALAKAAGYTEIKKRSLLSYMENYVTVHLEAGRPMFTPSGALTVLRNFLPKEKVDTVKELSLTADGKGAVFDVPVSDLEMYLTDQDNATNDSLKVVKTLPPLQEKEEPRGKFGGGRYGRFSGGRGGRFSGGSFRGGRGGRR
ncbi:hypothetical protein V2J09_014520 [Rumex salicifolius]